MVAKLAVALSTGQRESVAERGIGSKERLIASPPTLRLHAVVTFTVHTMSAAALNTDQAKTIGEVLIVGLIVLAVLISMIVKAILKRVVVLVLALVLAGVVYGQRASIQSAARKCDATFFGTHLTPANPTLKKRCQRLTSR